MQCLYEATEADRERIVRDYQAGLSGPKIAKALGWNSASGAVAVLRIVKAAGVPARSFSAALMSHCDLEVYQISAERWNEIYWHEPFPSLNELGDRFGTSDNVVRKCLVRAGVKIRTRSHQRRLDWKHGRSAGGPPPPSSAMWGPEQRQAAAQRLRANGARKASQTPQARAKMAAAKRKRVVVPCMWCGTALSRQPAQAQASVRSACSHSCRAKCVCLERWHPGTPRPLIVARLQALSEERLRPLRERNRDGTLQPPRWDQLEKIGAEIGAREPELLAVYEHQGGMGI